MSERWSPKKLRHERSAAIAAGAPASAPSTLAEVLRAHASPAVIVVKEPVCRLHGQPWRSCTACSIAKKKEA